MWAGLKAGLAGAAVAVPSSLLLPVPRVVWLAVALGAAGGAIFSSLQRERLAPTAGPEAGE